MKVPTEVPVMTLPNATLFPQALLPLYIFEPRYRRMLVDVLHSHRMFSVSMQKPGRIREAPSSVAGLGLVRVSVSHRDGTSHLILQGIARVQLAETIRYKPYRVHRVRLLEPSPCDSVMVDALLAKVKELVEERIDLGLPFPFPVVAHTEEAEESAPKTPAFSAKDVLNYLDKLSDPEQAADLISCAVLPGAQERQTILETVNVEARLRHLIQFLIAEIRRRKE